MIIKQLSVPVELTKIMRMMKIKSIEILQIFHEYWKWLILQEYKLQYCR